MTAQVKISPVHMGLEASLRSDTDWFKAHPERRYRMRAATPNDALQHECDKAERWVIVRRPEDGFWMRYHAVAEDAVPDAVVFTDANAEEWLSTHPHRPDTYAITDQANTRLFEIGPAPAATAQAVSPPG
jgi:hypothetical protein